MLLLASCALALIFRLGYLQVYQHEEYKERAESEHWGQKTVYSHRGIISDRNGYPLVTALPTYDVYYCESRAGATPPSSEDTARALAPLLETAPQDIEDQISAADGKRVMLKQSLNYEAGKKVASLRVPGVEAELTMRRSYAEGSLASSLLGFVGKEQRGLTGIEADFNREVGGAPGQLLYEQDSTGAPIPFGASELTAAQPGGDLVLTIDRRIQLLAEQKLDEVLAKQKSTNGCIIVMDPQTGAILAMASRPTFDVSRLDLADGAEMDDYRNRAVTDMYEPGSVFKVITMAAALNEGLLGPDTAFACEGPVQRYGWSISTWNSAYHGRETMTEVLQHSCNAGAVWVSDILGADRFYEYAHAFGFGAPTGVGLSGESPGQLRWPDDPEWRPIDLMCNSFGQAINVTPVQLVSAVAAVANGGKLMRPYVVAEARSESGTKVYEPVMVRRVLSEETARTLRGMLNAAAEQGESQLAIVPGYHIGGKTGTSSVAKDGVYVKDATIASFVGFIPYEDPKVVILVKVDEPQKEPWGSLVASPVFSDMAAQIMTYLRVPPSDPEALARLAKATPTPTPTPTETPDAEPR